MSGDLKLGPTHRASAINAALAFIAESANADPELVALSALVAVFERLSGEEQSRVIDYAIARYVDDAS